MNLIEQINALAEEIDYDNEPEFFMIFAATCRPKGLKKSFADMGSDISEEFDFATYRTFKSASEVINFTMDVWKNREFCQKYFSVIIAHMNNQEPWEIDLTAHDLPLPPDWAKQYLIEKAKIGEAFAASESNVIESEIELG